MGMFKTIEQQEKRISGLQKEVVSLLMSRRTPDDKIIMDDFAKNTLHDIYCGYSPVFREHTEPLSSDGKAKVILLIIAVSIIGLAFVLL